MPVIKSAMKRMRQETVRRERNRKVRNEYRASIKALVKAIEAGDGKLASQQLVAVQSQLARAAKKGIMHKNAAARKLSRLSARVKEISSGKKPKATAKKTATKAATQASATKKTTPKAAK